MVSTDPPRIVGYAVISRIYSTWEGKSLRLGDLYVVPGHRRKGVGTSLLRSVVQDCQRQGCSRIDCSPQASNVELISFLERHGAKDILSQEGWSFYQLSRENMETLQADRT
ncbi:hypothetical protein HPB48_007206 [Haemaphysalis longicornis]|uniref:N-acetyltransferase domain-containing protein n=1 Tax=Haemaphysalis longicornis TaxID=44386 RepID=A0A9J6G4P9_HAELO|nr:hypothetical protein HPB48_007206 [Haemaphysalis longicornis]